MITSAQLGFGLIVVGVTITGYHSERLLTLKRYDRAHLVWALIGVVAFGVGQNLVADSLHDRLPMRNR